jgi:hypothetical protein
LYAVAVAVPMVGAPGTLHVVILFDDELDELFPAALVAYTVNVYAVPVVKPLTVMVPEPDCDTVPVIPPGEDTAVYDVIGCAEVSVLVGAVYVTVAVVEPVDVAVPIVGALGSVKYAMISHLELIAEYTSAAFNVVLNRV